MVFNWFKRLFTKKDTSEFPDRQTDRQTDILVPSELEKDSLQLGFAAGYTGRSIHDINYALERIETMMPSKDWLLVKLEELERRHEEGEERRLKTLLDALESLRLISTKAPEPIKTELLKKIEEVKSKYGITRRINDLIQLVKESGEASFSQLATKMNLSGSGFRTLVKTALERTNQLEKFDMGKKEKWLRYRPQSIPDRQTDVQTQENQTNEQTDKQT